MITVINRRLDKNPQAIYAGRPGPFGNPFRPQTGGSRFNPAPSQDREAVVKQFHKWFNYSGEFAAQRMRKLALELPEDAILSCWCVPLACHAQVIADYVNEKRKEQL